MKVFFPTDQHLHHPPFEIFEFGQHIQYYESPNRFDNVITAIKEECRFELLPAENFGIEPILRVHSPEYVNFLRTIYRDWLLADEDMPDGSGLYPTTRPHHIVSTKGKGLSARLGTYVTDLSAPIHENTYIAALSSAHSALSAAKSLTEGALIAAAACRPPGHHAGKQSAAGYCYLNNTSIAANWLSKFGKVAILDIDYHAGNGSQEIFYDRADVLTISLHADPSEEYPYYQGFADETGQGAGEGFHHNFPLPKGCGKEEYLEAFEKALELVKQYAPAYIVVAAGFDTYKSDPLGTFQLSGKTYSTLGKMIKELDIPTSVNLEGGYYIPKLGTNFVKFLKSWLD